MYRDRKYVCTLEYMSSPEFSVEGIRGQSVSHLGISVGRREDKIKDTHKTVKFLELTIGLFRIPLSTLGLSVPISIGL